jgi:hypothetical protein
LVGGEIHSRVGIFGLAAQHLAGGAVVADVGHARTDEHLVDLLAGHIRQRLDVVGIVGAGQQRLLDLAMSMSITAAYSASASGSINVGFASHSSMPLMRRSRVLGSCIAIGDHPLEQRDVAVQVFDDRLLVQPHRAAGGGAFGGSIGQFESLFHLQIGQPLDFQDAPGEDVFLAFLRHGQQTRF